MSICWSSDRLCDDRELMERSTAAQCPSVGYQLAGAKKIQQDLAAGDIVDRFVDGPEEAALIRACFAGQSLFHPCHSDACNFQHSIVAVRSGFRWR